MTTRNLPPNELTFRVDGDLTLDLSTYSDIRDFLSDIWNHTFAKYDSRISTWAASDLATRAQDRGEIFWRYEIEGLEYGPEGFRPAAA